MLKNKLFRIISRFQLDNAKSSEEAICYFINNLLDDLKTISQIKLVKIAATVRPLKEKLLDVRINEAEQIINHFNEIVKRTNDDWETLLKRWYSPKELEAEEHLNKELTSLKDEYNIELYELSLLSLSAVKNLRFLGLNYNLKGSEKEQIDSFEEKLLKLSKINYKELVKYLKNGKLPSI